MQEILTSYRGVSGGFPYMGLFFLSLLFLFVVYRKQRELWFYPNLLALFVLFNPLMIPFLNRYLLAGGGGVTWRIWWLMPIPFLIAMMFTKTLDYVKGKEKILVAIMMCLIIILSGNYIFNSTNFRQSENAFQLPPEVLEISRMISQDSLEQGIEEENVVAVYEVAWRLRLYNPEIRMLFGRRPDTRTGIHAVELFKIVNSEEPDFEHADSLLREDNVSYIVVNRQGLYEMPEHLKRPENLGYELVGVTENHRVYRTDF